MQKIMLLFGAMLLLSVSAAAQGNISTLVSTSPAPSSAFPAPSPYGEPPWQISFGYQYNRFKLASKPITTEGYNISLVRFLNDWFGLQSDMGVSFGKTGSATDPPNLSVKPLFLGGGVHLAHRSGRVEPWVHALIGAEHFQFTQTTTLGGKAVLGWQGGAGMDFRVTPRFSVRGEADYLGTHFDGAIQTNFQIVAGLVANF